MTGDRGAPVRAVLLGCLAALVTLSSACSSASTSAAGPSERQGSSSPTGTPSGAGTAVPERWTKVQVSGIQPVYKGSKPLTLAGGRGFVVLTTTLAGTAFSVSPDGTAWTPASPGGFAPGSSVADLTGSEQGIYALGVPVGSSQPVVWRFEDGRSWGPAVSFTGPGGQVFGDVRAGAAPPGGDPRWSIGSGPAGVLVAHLDQGERSLTWWVSSDGDTFRRSSLALPATPAGGALVEVAGTDDGFLVVSRGRLVSVDARGAGTVLSVTGLPKGANVDLMAARGRIVVLSGQVITTLKPGDPEYRPDDQLGANDVFAAATWCGSTGGSVVPLSTADVPPGRLPDLGVLPRGNEIASALGRDGDLFTLVGATDVGAMWTSRDGCTWAKAPVKDNGFHTVDSLAARASGGGRSLLLGTKLQDDNTLKLTAWMLGGVGTGSSAAATAGEGGGSPSASAVPSSGSTPAQTGDGSTQQDPADAYRQITGEKSGNCPTGGPPTRRCVFAVLKDAGTAVVTVYDRSGAKRVALMKRSAGSWRVSETYEPGSGPPPEWAVDSVVND